MSSQVPGHARAVVAALVVTALWSSSWILIRWGLDDEALEPLTFAALRYGLAAIVLATWTLARRASRTDLRTLDRRALGRIAGLGVVFYAVTQGAQFVAIDNQPAATTSLVLSWTPLLVGVVGGRFISERPTARQVGGAGLVVAGAGLYFAGDLGATVIGMSAALVGLVANVAGSLLGRSENRRSEVSPTVITAISMTTGAAILFATGVSTEGWPTVSFRAWAIVAWLAVVNTALAFTLWNYSLRRLSALESAAINNTMLIQIAFLAWIFLDETLGAREVAGILLVSLGISMAQSTLRVRRVRSNA